MKTSTIILLTLFMTVAGLTLYGQTEREVDSRITEVTVFLNKAQVTREIKTRIEPGKSALVLTGLTTQIDQQSIQVSGKGHFTILGTSHRRNFLTGLDLPKAVSIIKDSISIMQKQLTLEQNQKEILNKEEQMLLSNQKIGGANQNLTVTELKAMADFFRARLTDIAVSRMKQNDKIEKITLRLNKLQQQLNEENDLYARNTSEIVVTVSAENAASAEIEVNYIVNNAGWQPIYDLRAKDTKNPVQLNYKANVFQNTGEEWRNVELTLSTANPSLGGLKPELVPWYLNFFQPVYPLYYKESKKDKVMRSSAPAAQPEMMMEMEDSAAGTAADFVSTIQTTLNTAFSIALPYTVASSNKPTLVDIRSYEMKANYLYAVAPKLDQDAFLLAQATGWEEFNLLPGEANVFFEGTFVGTSYIDPNNIKDTLNISLGRDKRVVVKREKLKDLSSRKLIGTNQKESYAYEISIRNTKNEAIRIMVEDQVPVSQNSQIEVTLTDMGSARFNKDKGKLVWELNLQPGEVKKVVYKFEVKYPKDKHVSGL